MKKKLVRITTIPISLKTLLKGQHRFMDSHGFEVIGVSSPECQLQELGKDEDIRVFELKMTRTISPFRDLKAILTFYRFCKEEKPLIVHSHTPKAGLVGMLGAKLAGVPIRLHTVAGMPLMEASGLKRTILDLVEKFTYSCASKIYPNSVGLYNFILEGKYTKPSKLQVIARGSSNGIDTSFFSFSQVSVDEQKKIKEELEIGANDFVFIFVGRLVGDKGINELVRAFCGINYPNIKLLLVGSMEKNLDPLAPDVLRQLKGNPNIISVGFQKDVRPYFAIANALVFPSYREGFPNVVMQAGAMGLPSIVSNINGCNEIIVEGVNGTIIPVKNADCIQSALLKFMDDTIYYNSLKENARAMITARYEQKTVWNALLAEYHRLLDNLKTINH